MRDRQRRWEFLPAIQKPGKGRLDWLTRGLGVAAFEQGHRAWLRMHVADPRNASRFGQSLSLENSQPTVPLLDLSLQCPFVGQPALVFWGSRTRRSLNTHLIDLEATATTQLKGKPARR